MQSHDQLGAIIIITSTITDYAYNFRRIWAIRHQDPKFTKGRRSTLRLLVAHMRAIKSVPHR